MKKNSGTFEISKRTAYFGDALGSGMIRLDMEPGTYAYAVRRRKGNMSYVNYPPPKWGELVRPHPFSSRDLHTIG